jgi:hypothetical protein
VWIQRLTGQSSVLTGTLSSTITATDTSIPITSLVSVPNAGFIRIGTELIGYNEYSVADGATPAYLLNCTRGQDGTTAAAHTTGAAISLVQKQSITVWPTPDGSQTYQFVYWRMRRVQDAGNGVNVMDIPFRFVNCLTAGLAYYLALKVPGGMERLQILKAQYDEAWMTAADEDQERAAIRLVHRHRFN